MLYEGAALVSENASPFHPTRDAAARHVVRANADVSKAIIAAERGAVPAKRPSVSNFTPASAALVAADDTPKTQFYRHSCMDHDTVHSLQEADDFAAKLLGCPQLPFVEAVAAHYSAAAALPLASVGKKLIVEKATASAKDVEVTVLRVALLAGLLRSRHVVDRGIVDREWADQVEGDTLCSVLQRVASSPETEHKTKDFVAMAQCVGGVGGPELMLLRPANIIASPAPRPGIVTPSGLVAATKPGPSPGTASTVGGWTPAACSSSSTRGSPVGAGTRVPFVGKRAGSPSTLIGRAGAIGRRFSSSSSAQNASPSPSVPETSMRMSRRVRSLVGDSSYNTGAPTAGALSACDPTTEAEKRKHPTGTKLDFDEEDPVAAAVSSSSHGGRAGRSAPPLTAKMGAEGAAPRSTRTATAVTASSTGTSAVNRKEVDATGAPARSTRTATTIQALAADTSEDVAGKDVNATRAAPRGSRMATAAKALAADTSAVDGGKKVNATRAAPRSTWAATAGASFAADTSAVGRPTEHR